MGHRQLCDGKGSQQQHGNTEEPTAENISMNASQIEQTLININLEGNKNYQELIQIIEQQKREKQRIELRLKNSSDAERRRALELEQVKASEKMFKQLYDKHKHELKMILGVVGDKTQAENLLESKKQSEKTIRMQVKKINELEAHVVTMTGDVSKKDEENSQISKKLATALEEKTKAENEAKSKTEKYDKLYKKAKEINKKCKEAKNSVENINKK